MKGYKGFNKDFTCRGFKYDEGKEYKIDEKPELCLKGFHYCENPFDVWDYCDLATSEFGEIEAVGEINKDKSKSVTNHIKIVKKLALKEFIEAGFNYLMTICKTSDTASSQVRGITA
jgi:hypothetical protein